MTIRALSKNLHKDLKYITELTANQILIIHKVRECLMEGCTDGQTL